MKKFSHLVTLLPCHDLEDFPTHGSKAEAQSLLAAWTGLWHPELISATGEAPQWRRASATVSSEDEAEQHRESSTHQHYYDDDEEECYDDEGDFEFDPETFESRWRDCLIVIPSPAEKLVFAGFEPAVANLGATVIKGFQSRTELLSKLDFDLAVGREFVDDFFALAYVRLQVELMTRKLRFSSELNTPRFNTTVLKAAEALVENDADTAHAQMQAAFDQLAEEKNRYYPVAANLVDMILATDSIRPESIEAELERDSPLSFLVSGSAARNIAKHSPATAQAIRSRIEDADDCIVGGPENELPDNLLSIESILNQLKLGRVSYQEVFGVASEVFMRRRFGLNASLPGILESFGCSGALHVLLDKGAIPRASSNSLRWMGVDGSAIMAVSETPLDGASDKSFLELGVNIGAELDSAHVATVFFARWPTQTCDSLQDVRNATRFGNILGDFSSAESYFENVYDPGYGDTFEAEEYQSPWLVQAIGSGSNRPISTFIDYWNRWYKLSAAEALMLMWSIKDSDANVFEASTRLQEFQTRIELQTLDWDSPNDDSIVDDLEDLIATLVAKVGGYQINTTPWRRRTCLTFDEGSSQHGSFHGDGVVKHVSSSEKRNDAVVELSGFGQLWLDPLEKIGLGKQVAAPLVDDTESILRNEFFEVRMDRNTGGIAGVYFYGKRGNLVSQKLAVRQVDSKTREVHYSRMVCESFEVITLSQIASEIRTAGILIDDSDQVLARFSQVVGLQRGRNVIEIDIELSEVKRLDGSTMNYIANRIAWSEASAELYCDIQGGRQAVTRPSIEAPHYIEVAQAENRFALLTMGLPWHKRASKKLLDSILVAGNEARRKFSLGLAINPESAMQLAVAEMHPVVMNQRDRGNQEVWSAESAAESSWLFHIANRNIIATSCRPVLDDDCRCSGMRVRLQEVHGIAGTLKLYCTRDIELIEKESLGDEPTCEVRFDQQNEGSPTLVQVPIAANELVQIHFHWSD